MCMGGLIVCEPFEPERTALFFSNCVSKTLETDASALEISQEFVGYLMGMTMGNAHLIAIVAEYCVYNHVIGVDKRDGSVVWLHSHAVSHLRSCQIDGVLGIAFSHFDRLGTLEQFILKTIAALTMDAFSVGHIVAAIDAEHLKDKKKIGATMATLDRKGILTRVEPYIDHYKPDKYLVDKDPCYTFTALFFRLAAEKLVLKSAYTTMKARKVELGIQSITLLDAKQALQSTGGGGKKAARESDDEKKK